MYKSNRNKVKTGLGLFTCLQGYSNTWKTDKILIITPWIQGNPTVIKNGLQDINRPN